MPPAGGIFLFLVHPASLADLGPLWAGLGELEAGLKAVRRRRKRAWHELQRNPTKNNDSCCSWRLLGPLLAAAQGSWAGLWPVLAGLSVCLSVCLSVSLLSVCLVCLSVYVSVCLVCLAPFNISLLTYLGGCTVSEVIQVD